MLDRGLGVRPRSSPVPGDGRGDVHQRNSRGAEQGTQMTDGSGRAGRCQPLTKVGRGQRGGMQGRERGPVSACPEVAAMPAAPDNEGDGNGEDDRGPGREPDARNATDNHVRVTAADNDPAVPGLFVAPGSPVPTVTTVGTVTAAFTVTTVRDVRDGWPTRHKRPATRALRWAPAVAGPRHSYPIVLIIGPLGLVRHFHLETPAPRPPIGATRCGRSSARLSELTGRIARRPAPLEERCLCQE